MGNYIKFEKRYNVLKDYESLKADERTFVCNDGTDDEVLFVPQSMYGYFPITSLSKDDFEARGYNADSLTDEQMERIARKMSESYIENQYWLDIDYWADELNLPKN